MNLPPVVSKLIEAQNNFDSKAYADCFNESAVAFDEGHTHKGKTAIEQWIDEANKKYKATMKALEYSSTEHTLKAEASGDFPGSPVVMTYYFEFGNGLIQSLKIA